MLAMYYYYYYLWFIKNIQFGCQGHNYIEFTKKLQLKHEQLQTE